MPRARVVCLTIVAAFQLRLAAAGPPPIAHVPIAPSVASLASRVNMDAVRDRARFVPEIIRRVYTPPLSRQIPLNLVPGVREALEGSPTLVDVPLTPDVWSAAVFRRPIPADQLLVSILADRRAALLCRGLAAADDETLGFYADHPALLTFIYERAAAPFSAFANAFHVRDGRLLVPGGAAAQPLWELVAGARVGDPDAFLRALFLDPEARSAYLFDVLFTASPSARSFALGLWIDDEALRLRRFQALDLAVRTAYREWHVDQLPFARPLNDLAILLLRIRVNDRGEPQPPAQRRFWATVFETSATAGAPADALPASHALVDAAWLLSATAGDMYVRGDKLDQLAFGQRVLGRHPEGSGEQAAAVLHEMPTRRMLLMGLERIGATDPAVYAAGLKQARAAADGGDDRFWTLAQLQGALALIIRMFENGSLDATRSAGLARSIFALPLTAGELRGGLAEWLASSAAAFLPPGETWQQRVVAAAAGGPTPGDPQVEWEGQPYRLDLAFAERRRIEQIQQHQEGPDLDVALAVAALGRRAIQSASIDAAKPIAEAARQLLEIRGAKLTRPPVTAMAPGVPVPRDGREWLGRVADELERGIRTGDLHRVSRAGESLVSLGDVLLGHAMISLVYAMHLGDPNGPAQLGASVALRHDFGFARRDGEGRARGPWAQPRQDFQPGVPWHVVGSIVGLDLGLAPLALHRLSMDGLAEPPKLQSIEREAFAVNVALLNPRNLTDLDRDRIVTAVAAGRNRVRELAGNPADFEKLEAEIGLDGWRARTIRWVLQNDPRSVDNQFSLADLLVLGGGGVSFDTWGANALLPYGCACARFPTPTLWRVLAGRTQLAMMAAATVEMNLEMAQRLAALRLPAALLPFVLATAMQDFIDRVDTADANDWVALTEFGRTLTRNAVDDYIAATATLDGPLVTGDVEAREP